MALQLLTLGTANNDGTGDLLKVGGAKINANFTEVYSTLATLAAAATAGTYDPAAVAITGGTITGTPISGSTGSFTGISSPGIQYGTSGAIEDDFVILYAGGQNRGVVFRDITSSLTDTKVSYYGWNFGNAPLQTTGNVRIGEYLQFSPVASLGTPDAGTGRIGVIAGEVNVCDASGNVSVISPHAKDAPPALYEIGPGVDEVLRRANVYLATVQWWATTRRQALDVLDLSARTGTHEESVAAWTEFGARQASGRTQCAQTETFAAYETRTGNSLAPADQDHDWWLAHTPAERWAKVESDRAAKAQTAHDAWLARKAAAQTAGQPFAEAKPALYTAQPAPAWVSAP